jgi:hypothetical protein
MESTTAIPQGLRHNQPLAAKPGARRIDAAQLGYISALAITAIGWLLTRNDILFDPLNGAGYWLGIVGASLMALLLLYPVRKRVRLFRHLGATRHWFQMHMILGVVGPILILYHCNFRLGSLNSTIALYCTLLVAGSGLIGRYIYRHLYSDLDGHRVKLQELIANARVDSNERRHISVLVPDLLDRMSAWDSKVLTPPQSLIGSLLLPFVLTFSTRIAAIRLTRYARRQIAVRAMQSDVIANQWQRLDRIAAGFIHTHLRRVRRVAELQSYERLFALWHIFHLPFFYLMVITALVHVLAVHMY